MPLILNLNEGDTFNVGWRRFRVSAIHPENGCTLDELGGSKVEVTQDHKANLNDGITFQESLRKQPGATRLMVDAPQSLRIWRGHYSKSAPVSLLAPVPIMHLNSATDVCEQNGRVAFGSRAWEVFRKLDEAAGGEPCDVLIYASHDSPVPGVLPKATWRATYLRHLDSRGGAHPDGMKYRPPTTSNYASDNVGHWAIFWEVTDLRLLSPEGCIPMSELRGDGKRDNYVSSFRPEGPLIIEPIGITG